MKETREEEKEREGERPSVPGAPAPGDLTGSPRALRTLTLFPFPLISTGLPSRTGRHRPPGVRR